MKPEMSTAAILALTAFFTAMVCIFLLARLGKYTGLIDKPGLRKVHQQPIPVVGGIAIGLSMIVALQLNGVAEAVLFFSPVLIIASLTLLFTGVVDDRFSIRPGARLLIQFSCAIAVAAGGIRITSLYGILGIGQIPIFAQYALTVIVITGVTNAFNLIDGIDGLAGGLSVINLTVLLWLSWRSQEYVLFYLLVAGMGSVFAFLRSNLNPAKIFMGDGGSLSLGFLMVVTGIYLLEKENQVSNTPVTPSLILVPVLLLLPALDSLRVYAGRIKKGGSPFKADKTHLHHLLLNMGFSHGKSALIIFSIHILLIVLAALIYQMTGFLFSFLAVSFLFLRLCGILAGNTSLLHWSKRIQEMEESGL